MLRDRPVQVYSYIAPGPPAQDDPPRVREEERGGEAGRDRDREGGGRQAGRQTGRHAGRRTNRAARGWDLEGGDRKRAPRERKRKEREDRKSDEGTGQRVGRGEGSCHCQAAREAHGPARATHSATGERGEGKSGQHQSHS